jgi:hypothetical protein
MHGHNNRRPNDAVAEHRPQSGHRGDPVTRGFISTDGGKHLRAALGSPVQQCGPEAIGVADLVLNRAPSGADVFGDPVGRVWLRPPTGAWHPDRFLVLGRASMGPRRQWWRGWSITWSITKPQSALRRCRPSVSSRAASQTPALLRDAPDVRSVGLRRARGYRAVSPPGRLCCN